MAFTPSLQPAEIQKAQYKILRSLIESPDGTMPDEVREEVIKVDQALNFGRPVEYGETPEDRQKNEDSVQEAARKVREGEQRRPIADNEYIYANVNIALGLNLDKATLSRIQDKVLEREAKREAKYIGTQYEKSQLNITEENARQIELIKQEIIRRFNVPTLKSSTNYQQAIRQALSSEIVKEIQAEIDRDIMNQMMAITQSASAENPSRTPEEESARQVKILNQNYFGGIGGPLREEDLVQQNTGVKSTRLTDEEKKRLSRYWQNQFETAREQRSGGLLGLLDDSVNGETKPKRQRYQNFVNPETFEIMTRPVEPVKAMEPPVIEPQIDPVTGRVKRRFDLE